MLNIDLLLFLSRSFPEEVTTDRYARLNHGYIAKDGNDLMSCSDYNDSHQGNSESSVHSSASSTSNDNNDNIDNLPKPAACTMGSQDAQDAVSFANLLQNSFSFFSSSLVGSISDIHGRKKIMIVALLLGLLGPIILILLQIVSALNPMYYYLCHAISGIVNWRAIALSALSDIIPRKWRAGTFGSFFAFYAIGFALAPILALFLSHIQVSILSMSTLLLALFITIFSVPETLPSSHRMTTTTTRVGCNYHKATINNNHNQLEEDKGTLESSEKSSRKSTTTSIMALIMKIVNILIIPFKELSILNRNRTLRLLASLAFFSGMVTTADITLFVYYLENSLNFQGVDIAIVFMLMGGLGIIVQGCFIKVISDCVGEQNTIIIAFLFGSIHNLLYGVATNKATIFIAVALSSIAGMSFPTISAVKSIVVDETEQGRIQGALYALQALAAGVGPITLRFIYNSSNNIFSTSSNNDDDRTQSTAMDEPTIVSSGGIMFIFASFFMTIAVVCAWSLPKEKVNSKYYYRNDLNQQDADGINSSSISKIKQPTPSSTPSWIPVSDSDLTLDEHNQGNEEFYDEIPQP